jgi:hypothetical protein
VVVSYIPIISRDNMHGSDPETKRNLAQRQIGKKVRKKYGDLPEKLPERPIAWNRVDVDLIGTLKINKPSGKK